MSHAFAVSTHRTADPTVRSPLPHRPLHRLAVRYADSPECARPATVAGAQIRDTRELQSRPHRAGDLLNPTAKSGRPRDTAPGREWVGEPTAVAHRQRL